MFAVIELESKLKFIKKLMFKHCLIFTNLLFLSFLIKKL